MKKWINLALGVFAVILIGCSGSETYRGSWKATNLNGTRSEMVFDAKTLTIKDSLGKSVKLDYTQNSVNINNSVETYGIKLGDGRGYQINFPRANDESIGLIKDENGNPIYAISRNDYVTYEELYKLN